MHTNVVDEGCPIQSPLDTCYYKIATELDPRTIYKEPIQGVSFSSCEDNGIDYEIQGEQGFFPCFGYTLDIPNGSSPKDFQEIIDSHRELLFGTSARGLNIEATLYSPNADYWAYVQVLYEYGVQGEQVFSTPKANFQTFRLNIY